MACGLKRIDFGDTPDIKNGMCHQCARDLDGNGALKIMF